MAISKRILYLVLTLIIMLHQQAAFSQQKNSPLAGKTICLDAGHGGTALTDSYRVGPTGEREEWINLRVALLLQKQLEERGAIVLMTRTADDNISFEDRIQLATGNKADAFISVHHNATADPKANFPIIYFHGNASENKASVALGRLLAKELSEKMYTSTPSATVVSDHAIFPMAGAKVLRGTYGIPGIIAEASFFTNPAEEGRLKQEEHNVKEVVAYVSALESFFTKPIPAILPKNSKVTLPPFKAFQEAERVGDIALLWHQDFTKGSELMKSRDKKTLEQAYELLTRSARSFPDSYVAAQCHLNRSYLLKKLGKHEEAKQEKKRANEFYVNLGK